MRQAKQTLIYILQRLVLMAFTFIIIFFICFILVRLLPVSIDSGMKDPEVFYKQMVSQGRMKYDASTGEYINVPVFEQLGVFIKGFFTPGNSAPWGLSYKIEWLQTPDKILWSKMTPTVLINIYSMILSIPLGIGLGIFMALKKNKWEDHLLNIVVMLFISVPSFVFAFVLQDLFAYKWMVLPAMLPTVDYAAGGWIAPEMFKAMILPVLAMSFGSIAGFARYTRAELTEVLTSDFMLLARTKGLTKTQATVRHAFRNSLVPIFPMILGTIISVLSGSLIIENIFGVPGVGALYLESINKKDYDVFQYVSMFYIAIGLIGTLIVDISYGLVDPRIRMGSKK
ncbi:MAG TPA: ABC transporter permease [Firmicutes bacterium]|nr:ABC transporter permease [Bacillota bacterium]